MTDALGEVHFYSFDRHMAFPEASRDQLTAVLIEHMSREISDGGADTQQVVATYSNLLGSYYTSDEWHRIGVLVGIAARQPENRAGIIRSIETVGLSR